METKIFHNYAGLYTYIWLHDLLCHVKDKKVKGEKSYTRFHPNVWKLLRFLLHL